MAGRDLRAYARQTGLRLVIGALLVLFIVGDGLIFLIYGPGAAGMGLLCLVGALAPVGLVWLILFLIEWMVKRANR
jgi:hypothetical protein